MRTLIFLAITSAAAWGQVPPLPGSQAQQWQYQQRLNEIERFNQQVERQRQWMQDQETTRQLHRLHEDRDDHMRDDAD